MKYLNDLLDSVIGAFNATGDLCPPADPVPWVTSLISEPGGYLPGQSVDFAQPGWKCLDFSVEGPTQYQFNYMKKYPTRPDEPIYPSDWGDEGIDSDSLGFVALPPELGPNDFAVAIAYDSDDDFLRFGIVARWGGVTDHGSLWIDPSTYFLPEDTAPWSE